MRKGFRCTIKLNINQVTCPGVWLSEGGVFLILNVFGRKFYSKENHPLFPLPFYQAFTFTKIYANCHNFVDVCKAQLGENIVIQLVQVHPKWSIVELARYEAKLANFLFPTPQLVCPYSGAERELLLNPSTTFPGIIGPKLEFSTNSTFEEIMDSCCFCNNTCKSCCTSEFYTRGRKPNRSNIELQPEDTDFQSENRPPFVVRKVDEKLFARVPSFFREKNVENCSYRCASPHRHGNCPACRYERSKSSPPNLATRLKRRNQSFTKRAKNYCTNCQRENLNANRNEYKLSESSSDVTKTNQNTTQLSPVLSSPRMNRDGQTSQRLTSHVSTVDREPSPATSRLRSPILERPSYRERFGASPMDATVKRPKALSNDIDSDLQHFDKADVHGCCHHYDLDCWCRQHLSGYPLPYLQCCRNCNDYECPLFWRYRFGSPYGFYNWRAFHRGLSSVYDDIYKGYI